MIVYRSCAAEVLVMPREGLRIAHEGRQLLAAWGASQSPGSWPWRADVVGSGQPGARRQNSLPYGSARTVHGTSLWPRSMAVAPRVCSLAASAARSSPGYGRTSRWTRFHTVFTSGVRRNCRYGPTPLAERSTALWSVTLCRVQSMALPQKLAMTRGSAQSTTTVAIGPVFG